MERLLRLEQELAGLTRAVRVLYPKLEAVKKLPELFLNARSANLPNIPSSWPQFVDIVGEARPTIFENVAGDLPAIASRITSLASLVGLQLPSAASYASELGRLDLSAARFGDATLQELRLALTYMDEIWDILILEKADLIVRRRKAGRQVAPRTAVYAPLASFRDLHLRFTSDHQVQLTWSGHSEVRTFAELGFADGRGGNKAVKPVSSWQILLKFARAGGVLERPKQIGPTAAGFEKRIGEIRTRLKVHFGLSEDPVAFDPSASIYRCAFVATAAEPE